MVEEKAYAKINLTLEIGKKREDNYHEIKTIMMPLNLYDELTFEKMESGILLLDNSLIKMEDNFVYKAAKLFLDTYNIKSGVKITLIKKIPSEAGLAGGSADAAATFRGLNELFSLNKSLDELASLISLLGSDMPYCIYNELSLCSGRGEIVKLLKIKYKKYFVLLIKPPFGLSTKAVYNEYKESLEDKSKKHESLIRALKINDIELMRHSMFNDLESPAFLISPELKKIKNHISLNYTVRMSGSGSTLFVISKKKEELLRLKEELNPYYDTILTSFL